MPCIGFICPSSRDRVPFDHFETCRHKRGRAAYPPAWARFEAQKIKGDVRHATMDLTATRALGCPRATFLQGATDYHIDLTKAAKRTKGSMGHSVCAEYSDPEHWISEGQDPTKTVINGTIGEYKISMAADLLRADMLEIVDYKFKNDFSIRYRKPVLNTKFDTNERCQLNMARIMLGQQKWATDKGYDPEAVLLTVWHGGCGKTEGPMQQDVPHITEDEILNSRPGGGNHTVEQIIQLHEWARVRYVEAKTPEERKQIAASVPLVGVPMFSGDMCPIYCDVWSECGQFKRQYGEPNVTWDNEEVEVAQEGGVGKDDILAALDDEGIDMPPELRRVTNE